MTTRRYHWGEGADTGIGFPRVVVDRFGEVQISAEMTCLACGSELLYLCPADRVGPGIVGRFALKCSSRVCPFSRGAALVTITMREMRPGELERLLESLRDGTIASDPPPTRTSTRRAVRRQSPTELLALLAGDQ